MRRCTIFRLPTAHPADVTPLLGLIAQGALVPGDIRAILGKTEGNGCVNDFTRAYAVTALQHALSGPLRCTPAQVGQRITMVMSGGTEGGLSPHLLIFATTDAPPTSTATPIPTATLTQAATPSLALGTAFTRDFLPEDLGRTPQIHATAEAVATAMADAGITDPASVHYVQVKCPLLTAERILAAAARGRTVATEHTYASMALSRGASALGVALALGEVPPDSIDSSIVCRRLDLWSGRAATSAGIELMRNEVIVMGNSPAWASDTVIAHRVMRDAIDLPAVAAVLADVGLPVSGQLDEAARADVVAVLAKADPSSTGRIRGARHTMLDDSDINATRHARALVGGVLAGVIGRTDLFVSGGAEHQGPDGGGPVAVIARRRPAISTSTTTPHMSADGGT